MHRSHAGLLHICWALSFMLSRINSGSILQPECRHSLDCRLLLLGSRPWWAFEASAIYQAFPLLQMLFLPEACSASCRKLVSRVSGLNHAIAHSRSFDQLLGRSWRRSSPLAPTPTKRLCRHIGDWQSPPRLQRSWYFSTFTFGAIIDTICSATIDSRNKNSTWYVGVHQPDDVSTA